jgi:ABC-2 type transport system permease protein
LVYTCCFLLWEFFSSPELILKYLSILPLYQFPHVWNFTTWISSFYNISLVLLVIMMTCNEFNNKTYKQQIIFGLSRKDLLIQKIILISLLSLYVVLLVGVSSIASGLVYSYKITPGLVFEQSWILATLFIQIFTYLCFGLLFSLIFRNMILSGVVYLMYRVIIEPIIRVNFPVDYRSYFPTKFVTNLTPRPEVLSLIQNNLQNQHKPEGNDMEKLSSIMPVCLPIWQNLILTLILIALLLFISLQILKKRRFN